MGASRDDCEKYPRTAHLFGLPGTDDDKHLGHKESLDFIADASCSTFVRAEDVALGFYERAPKEEWTDGGK